MNLKTRLSATLLTLATGLAGAAPLATVANASATSTGLSAHTTPRLVVKYREHAPVEAKVVAGAVANPTSREKVIAARAHYPLRRVKTVSDGAVVYDLGREVPMAEARAAAARIASDPTVEFAAPDVRVRLAAAGVSSDKYSYLQWPLFPRTSGSGGAAAAGGSNFAGAWATTRGANVVVGVIDSGGVASPDLEGQTVPGYDFVSENSPNVFSKAGDGDGRDSDSTDPGNFCAGTGTTPTIYSNWHGLQVAAVIVALADNTYGIAGAAPLAKVMHLRATGRCGGFMTDVADALKWSVGVHIDGIPDNSAPVQVVNLSISSAPGTVCAPFMQTAVDAAIRRNVPVVVAAGNEGVNDVGAPGNCVGVITVGGHTRSADLDTNSNYSSFVTLTAPSDGRCKNQGSDCIFNDVVSVGNSGLTTAGMPVEVRGFQGTSAAVPHVSAAIALIRSLDLTLTPAQITSILKATAKPHAADSYCAANFGSCGAGMLDASAAVAAVAFPVATITPSYTGPSSPGSTAVGLTAGVTSSMGSSYTWTQISGPVVALSGLNTATLSFTTPATSAPLVFQVTVGTAVNTSAVASFTVLVNNKPTLATTAYTAQVGHPSVIVLTGTDPEGDAITYSLIASPDSMGLFGDTLKWTPIAAGTFTATVALTDAKGLVNKQDVTFTVAAANTVSAPGGGSGGGGSTDFVFLGLLGLGLLAIKRKSR